MFRFISLLATTVLAFTIFVNVNAHFGKHFGGRHHHHLSFLANVTDEDKQQLFDIFTNLNITKAQKQTQMQQWAANQSEDVQTALTNLTQSRQNAIQNAFAKAASNLTEEAASLLTQIQEVVENQDITQLEECSQIQTLLSQADRSVALQLHIPRISCNALYGKSGHARIGKIFGHKRGLH
uniref:SXP/RAL-2 family protein Ani s 5-like cation-binding domain-containing protein n=1 Tax=Ditylenchus dipsaci TaxID=166011 RepID=A0A915DFX3_9BILA